MERPLLFLSGALALGCLIGGDLAGGPVLALASAAGVLLVLACMAPRPVAALWALGAAAVALGAAGAAVERRAHAEAPLARWLAVAGEVDEPVRLAGTAAADLPADAQRRAVVVDVDGISRSGKEQVVSGRVRVLVGGALRVSEIVEGDQVEVWATLRRPRSFGNPGSFDAEAHAVREGIHAHGSCKSALLVAAGGGGKAGALTRFAARVRRWARAELRRSMLPGPEQGLVRAMTLGDRSGIDEETAEAFRKAGTYHVLAISGAQVALLAGLLLAGARRLGAGPAATAAAVSSVLVFYAVLVGGDTPVARATVMAVVLLCGRALDLDADLANLLGAAALLLLAHRPSAIGDVGFQLSFVATLGILLLAQPLAARLPRLPLRLEALLAASLAAQLPLIPLLALHFHRLAVAALALNLAAVPLSGSVLLAGLGVLAVAALAPPLAPLAGDVAWIAGHALLRSADVVLLAPVLDLRVPSPTLWATAVLITGCVLLARDRGLMRGMACAAVGTLAIAFGGGPAGDGRLSLTVLDVGQGDALVLQSPSGRIWLIDAGGGYEAGLDLGEAVVGPYLWSQGVRRADRLLLTHAHPDHVGGARFLVRDFGVDDVWEGPAPRRDGLYDALAAALREAGPPRRAVARGVSAAWDGVDVQVIGPRPRGQAWRVRNDDSVVLAVTMGEVRLLLAGDMQAAEESELPPLAAAVVKVPHHGSRTSSTAAFVSAATPRLALVSVGLRNRFGHPSADVVDRYRRAGARVLRTDRDGAIRVTTDGRRVWVRTFRGGEEELVL